MGIILEPIIIRNLLETIRNLEESTGLAGRQPGAQFTDPATGDTIELVSLKFYPEGGGILKGEELDAAIEQAEADAGQKIQWENARSSRTGGFAIATFSGSGGPLAVGTYLQQVKPNPRDNSISNTILKKYRFAGKAAEKTSAGLMPQDLLTKKDDLTISDIMNQLAKSLGTDNPLYHVAHHIASGVPLPVEIDEVEGVSFTAFRDYFSEILQPMAMQNGLYTGNAANAAEEFLGTKSFKNTKISFGADKNSGLSDSVLTAPDGSYIKISTKGGKGAKASVSNILNTINELKETLDGNKLYNKYRSTIELIEGIQKAGQSGAPLWLGVTYNIISAEEAQIIRGLKNSAPVNLLQIDDKKLKDIGLTNRLISLVKSRSNKKPEATSLYYHLIAIVASKVADYVNENTNFSAAACAILNNGALIQVYTKASNRGGKWKIEQFDSVYPSESVTGVELDSKKNYSSTEIKGLFTFNILRGNAKSEDVFGKESEEVAVAPEPAEPGTVKKSRDLFVAPKDSEGDTKEKVGRERRKK